MANHIIFSLVITIFLVACGNKDRGASHSHSADSNANETQAVAKSSSPHTEAMGNIENVHVHIEYSAPSVRGRTIWNGLVAYNKVWVAGAHNATSIEFSRDVEINGQIIPYGKYAFFTIPDSAEWTIILNENYEQHLADDYDQQLDIIRMKVQPEVLEDVVETLTYSVQSEKNGQGAVTMAWEKIKITLPIKSHN